MQHLKTYTFNHSSADRADVESSNIHHIRQKQCGVWCDTLHIIGKIFLDAQLANLHGVDHYKASLIIENGAGNIDRRFKPEDPYTKRDFLQFVIEHMQPPTCKLTLSIYASRVSMDHSADTPWHTNLHWPMIDNNEPSDPPFITFHPQEQSVVDYHKGSDIARNHTLDPLMLSAIETLGLECVTLDYTMPPEVAYDYLRRSTLHVSYVGSSYWLAVALGTPVFQYGHHIREGRELLLHKGAHGATRGSECDRFTTFIDGRLTDTQLRAAGGTSKTGQFGTDMPSKEYLMKKLVDILSNIEDK